VMEVWSSGVIEEYWSDGSRYVKMHSLPRAVGGRASPDGIYE